MTIATLTAPVIERTHPDPVLAEGETIRRDLARHWWDAMRQAGLTPPKRPQYLAVLGYAQDVAGLRPALAEVA
jgi:hypothetical protein